MKKVIVLGGSGIGVSVASIVDLDPNATMMGYLNDLEPCGSMIGKYTKFPVLGSSEKIREYLQDPEIYFTIAYSGMQREKDVYEKILDMNIPEERLYSAVHPSAVIPQGFCKVGQGVIINALSQVGVDSEISNHCMLFANSYLGHDSFMDKLSHLASNAVVGSYVRIGRAVHVGMNAVIREHVKIGDYSLIGAGSVVLNDVPENCIVAGNPARILRYK